MADATADIKDGREALGLPFVREELRVIHVPPVLARFTKLLGGMRGESFEFVIHTDVLPAELLKPAKRSFLFLL